MAPLAAGSAHRLRGRGPPRPAGPPPRARRAGTWVPAGPAGAPAWRCRQRPQPGAGGLAATPRPPGLPRLRDRDRRAPPASRPADHQGTLALTHCQGPTPPIKTASLTPNLLGRDRRRAGRGPGRLRGRPTRPAQPPPSAKVGPSGDLEGLLGRAEELPRGEHRQLVALARVGVERKPPALLVAEVAQATQVRRGVAQPLQVLLTRLRPVRGRPAGRGRRRFGVGVDVTELPVEADLEPGVAAGEVLLGIAAQPLRGAAPDRLGDRRAAAVRREHPALRSWHQ